MKISLITAVFNSGNTLAATLESVSRQTYGNLEHIIQDGRSTDNSLDIVAAWKHKRMHVESQRDNGIYHALNRGIERSSGDVIGFLHSDDLFAYPDVLLDVVTAFQDKHVDGVYGDLVYVKSDDTTRLVRRWRTGLYNVSRLSWGWMPAHPTLYLRRDVYERLGCFDTSFSISADYEAMLRYLIFGRLNLVYIPEVLVKMRVGGVSNRSFGSMLAKSREDMRAIRRHKVGGVGTLIAKNLRKIPQFIT